MSEARAIGVLGLCGSLRTGSFNRAVLDAAIELKSSGMGGRFADQTGRNLIGALLVALQHWARQVGGRP